MIQAMSACPGQSIFLAMLVNRAMAYTAQQGTRRNCVQDKAYECATPILPRSAPRTISADQLTETTCVATLACLARRRNDAAPF